LVNKIGELRVALPVDDDGYRLSNWLLDNGLLVLVKTMADSTVKEGVVHNAFVGEKIRKQS
jgi:hypothetical protein